MHLRKRSAEREATTSAEVDLIVVHDHAVAVEICQALKHDGIRHVDFWPEDVLSSGVGLIGRGMFEPMIRFRAHEPQGPIHILVRDEDLARARLVLESRGLTNDAEPRG